MAEPPATKYGEWTRGNMGRVGRCVTSYVESLMVPGSFIPVVSWEEHPDEAGLPYPAPDPVVIDVRNIR